MSNLPMRTIILGFDLGDGESAVAECALSGSGEPDVLRIVDNRQSFLTCIGRDSAGQVLLGQAALDTSHATNVFLTFKQRPGSDSSSNRRLAAEFFREVMRRTERRGCDLNGAAIVVGHPSAWTVREVQDYVSILRGDTNWQVQGISESRAAFLQLKESRKLTVEQLRATTLIVDIGSSTTDFTLIKNLSQQPVDFGHNALGGRLIDRAILRHVVAAHPESEKIKGVLDGHPHIYAQCEHLCRVVKETFFSDEEKFRAANGPIPCKQYVEIDDNTIFRVKIGCREMDTILQTPHADLGGLSWGKAMLGTLQSIRDHARRHGESPRTLALTGGGARMAFTRAMCQQIFPDSTLVLDSAPEFTIVKGLTRAGRWDAHAAGFLAEIEPLCDSLTGAFRDEVKSFIDDVVPVLADHFVSNVVRRGLLDWRSGVVASLNELEAYMKNLGVKWASSDEVGDIVNQSTQRWTQRAMLHIAPLIQDITHRYHLPYESLNLTLDTVQPKGMDVNVDDLRNNTVAGVGIIAGGIAGVVALKIGLVITPMIMTVLVKSTILTAALAGPVGVLCVLLITGAAVFLGKEKAEEKVKEVTLPVWLRKTLLSDSKIDDACRGVRSDVETTLIAEMARAADGELIAGASGVVRSELENKMKQAVVLISR
jgi:hypothetical protein